MNTSKLIITVDSLAEYNLHQEYINGDWPENSQYKVNTPKSQILKELESLKTSQIKQKLKRLQKEWDAVNDEFFIQLEKITRHKPIQKEYECVICFKMNKNGFSNPLKIGNTFYISAEEVITDEDVLYIVAHELFHTIYYEFYESFKLPFKSSPTILTESTAILSLMFTNMSQLFPKSKFHTTNFINSHKETKENWIELLTLWKNKESFERYVYSVFQKYC